MEHYGTEKKPYLPVFTNARDKTSFRIIERQLQNLAQKSGLIMEMEEVGTHTRGEDVFHDIRIYIAKDEKELEEQKTKYHNLSSSDEQYEGEYREEDEDNI